MGQLQVRRLARTDVLVWLGLACVLGLMDFALSAWQANEIKRLHLTLVVPWWVRAVHLLSVAAFTACLVGSSLLVKAQCFRMLGRLQPGHWLVLLLALGGILACAAVPFEWLAASAAPGHDWGLLLSAVVVLSSVLTVAVAYGFAVVRLRDATRWKVLLALGLANVFLTIVLSAPMGFPWASFWSSISWWLGPCWWTLLIVVAVTAVAIDLRRRIARDWVHWLGVSLWTLGIASKLWLVMIAMAVTQPGLLDVSGAQLRLGGSPDGLPYERLGWDAGDFFTDRDAVSLCRAIERRDLLEIERLVKSGVDVNAKGRGNMTPLLWAFPMGEQVFAKVLALGGDPNVKLTETRIRPVFVSGRSVMSLAARSDPVVYAWGDISTENHLKLALEHGGDPNVEDHDGYTPLFFLLGDSAKLRKNLRLLLNAGVDINHRNQRGQTPLISSYLSIKKDSVLDLLEAGADYRIADDLGLDLVLYVASAMHDGEKQHDNDDPTAKIAKLEIARIQPSFDWLTNEGVNWAAARAALEDKDWMKTLKNTPADYKHRPWLPQRPTLKKPDP